jgi:hypothetical protein
LSGSEYLGSILEEVLLRLVDNKVQVQIPDLLCQYLDGVRRPEICWSSATVALGLTGLCRQVEAMRRLYEGV